MRRLLPLVAAVALAAPPLGLRPRPRVTDYPVYAAQDSIQVGAEAFDQERIHRSFATDFQDRYAVIEVAVYPHNGASSAVRTGDFNLRLANGTLVRPVASTAVVAALTRPPSSRQDSRGPGGVVLDPDVGVSVGNGGYDPVTGRRTTGVGVGGGVGVGIGDRGTPPPPPRTAERDRATMETELGEKALPEGHFDKPVAGYLYFPLPAGKKKLVVQALEYSTDAGVIRLDFPARKK